VSILKGVNLYLIGMMGAGKTTVGRELAKQLSYGFVDADNVIEQATKQSINQLFAREGEAGFRKIESDVLAQICSFTKLVISTGGGVILQQKNWSYLRHGLIVWLDVPVELLYTRLALDTTRPLLQDVDLKQKLLLLQEQRQALYNQADLRISVSEEETPEQVAMKVLEAIPSVLK
jgi:shikimate kinase